MAPSQPCLAHARAGPAETARGSRVVYLLAGSVEEKEQWICGIQTIVSGRDPHASSLHGASTLVDDCAPWICLPGRGLDLGLACAPLRTA